MAVLGWQRWEKMPERNLETVRLERYSQTSGENETLLASWGLHIFRF
jgi:hypothetical protein